MAGWEKVPGSASDQWVRCHDDDGGGLRIFACVQRRDPSFRVYIAVPVDGCGLLNRVGWGEADNLDAALVMGDEMVAAYDASQPA